MLPSLVVHSTSQINTGAHANFVSPEERDGPEKKVEEELFSMKDTLTMAAKHLCCLKDGLE